MTRADDSGETPDEWERKMMERIGALTDSHLVTKFLVVAEVIGDNGERWMHSVSSESCYEWDQLGLMESHKMFLASRNVANRLEGE